MQHPTQQAPKEAALAARVRQWAVGEMQAGQHPLYRQKSLPSTADLRSLCSGKAAPVCTPWGTAYVPAFTGTQAGCDAIFANRFTFAEPTQLRW